VRGVGQAVRFDKVSHRLTWRLVGETNLDGLAGVEISVPVNGRTERCGQSGAGRVNSLPNIAHVDTAGNFSDENGRQSERTQLIMYA